MKTVLGYLMFVATLVACGLAVDAALSSFTIGERAQGGYAGAGTSRDASEAIAEAEKAVGRLDAGERNDD